MRGTIVSTDHVSSDERIEELSPAKFLSTEHSKNNERDDADEL